MSAAEFSAECDTVRPVHGDDVRMRMRHVAQQATSLEALHPEVATAPAHRMDLPLRLTPTPLRRAEVWIGSSAWPEPFDSWSWELRSGDWRGFAGGDASARCAMGVRAVRDNHQTIMSHQFTFDRLRAAEVASWGVIRVQLHP
jgi:hypothetical protein